MAVISSLEMIRLVRRAGLLTEMFIPVSYRLRRADRAELPGAKRREIRKAFSVLEGRGIKPSPFSLSVIIMRATRAKL
jgi:hypothetical protein